MHTSSAPDEPGGLIDPTEGLVFHAEPTLTIPYQGEGGENVVWNGASTYDAYAQLDAPTRYNSTLVVGQKTALPYQFGVNVDSVAAYNPITRKAENVPPSDYAVGISGTVILNSSYAVGTAYTVEYEVLPVFIAFRRAGGLPHTRPFAGQIGFLPKRFRIVLLDLWSRARYPGDGPTGIDNPPQPGATEESTGTPLFAGPNPSLVAGS
jgi:hypothetical protein